MIQQPGNTDLSAEPVSGEFRDSFKRIFGALKEYHTELGYPKIQCNSADRLRQSNEIALGLFKEAAELVDAYPWKPWKQYDDNEADLVNLAEEGIDIIFFIAEMFELWGLDPALVADIFERKLIENNCRILNGYNKPAADM